MKSSLIKLGVVILIGIILVLTCEYVREAAREARKA